MKYYKLVKCPEPNMFCVVQDLRQRDDLDDIHDEVKELFKGTIQECENFLRTLERRESPPSV